MRNVQTENSVVGNCWNAFRRDLKTIVDSKGGEIKTCGIRFWDRPITLDPETGHWAEKGMHSKPSRWLLKYDDKNSPLNLADRMAYFSLRNEALAFAVRAVPVFFDEEQDTFSFIENLEWVVVFIAKSLTPRGSSSATAHASRLDEGLLTITTDDREFEVPLECIGLIKPENKLNSAIVRDFDDKLEQRLSQSVECYVLNDDQKRESFLQRIDQLQIRSGAETPPEENSWITDRDLQSVERIFKDGQSSLLLWGDDYSAINATIAHLEQKSAFDFVHYEVLPTWNEDSLISLIENGDLGDKIVCLHGSERLNPELVLPPILLRPNHIELRAADGKNIPAASQMPHCWIFTGHHLEPHQIRRWHRVAHNHLQWFRCEATVSATDAVQRIYQEEGLQTSSTNWFDNLFVIMWEELKAYLPASPELLASIVRSSLRQDLSGTWDLDATPIQKGIIVREIESKLSPMIASLDGDTRKQCVNALISTLEISQTQGQKLILLTKVF